MRELSILFLKYTFVDERLRKRKAGKKFIFLKLGSKVIAFWNKDNDNNKSEKFSE